MNFSDINLPSNRKFGFFFSFVFLLVFVYFFLKESIFIMYLFGSLSLLFFILSIVKANILLPINKLWMRFGILLGMIVSPIILGLIFFLIFTPLAISMRLFGRDELSLNIKEKKTHWKKYNETINNETFKFQF
tara:strand:- start:357 stop:755 length:399 start_codon:yes stop_codon:yes gene_type:complete